MNIVLDLTEREQEIFDEVLEKIEETAVFLAGLDRKSTRLNSSHMA